jgi:hypothetical protein
MNRLSWDTTAPRRLVGKRVPHPRPELGLLEETAELIRGAWRRPHRVGPFS